MSEQIALMKVPLRRGNDDTQSYACKECRLSFTTKESLERHKNKAGHASGWIYFGKNDK